MILLGVIAVISCGLNAARAQNDTNICSGVERFTDDSTHEVKLYSQGMWNNKVVPVIFSKLINQDTLSFSLYLSTHSDMTVKNGKGLIVVFTDSTIWNRPAKITAYPVNNSFEYNTVINLTQADALLFSTKTIAKYMLYIFNQEMDEIMAANFRASVRCIIDSR